MNRIVSLLIFAFIAITAIGQNKMYITIDGDTKMCTLVNNSSTKALIEQLGKGDITYIAHDYGNFEKVGDTGFNFPQNDEDITTVPGDVILYLGTSICLYYDENTWEFTRLGKIEGISQSEMKTFVKASTGNVTVTLSLHSSSAISEVKSNKAPEDNSVYSIDGKKLATAPLKGIYVENGTKKSR